MSYNVESITTIQVSDDFAISTDYVLSALAPDADLGDGFDRPEDNFLDMVARRKRSLPWTPLKRLSWSGDASGAYWQNCLDALTHTRGTFEGYVVWADGNAITGLRVVDGVVTEPSVVFSLAPAA